MSSVPAEDLQVYMHSTSVEYICKIMTVDLRNNLLLNDFEILTLPISGHK